LDRNRALPPLTKEVRRRGNQSDVCALIGVGLLFKEAETEVHKI